MEKLEALYQQTVSRISLSKPVAQKAWQSYKQVHSVNEKVYSENPIEWFVVHIYLALLEQAICSKQVTRQTTSVTVSLLLNISKIHCKEFITKLKYTMEQKLASPLTEDVVNELVRNYILTAALYDKCSRVFADIFVEECSVSSDSAQPNYHKDLCEKKKRIWLLYLLAKEETTFSMSELVTSFYVLLCCFIPTIKSTPTFLLKPVWGNLCSSSSTNHEQTNLILLQKMCLEYKADLGEIFVPILQSKQWAELMDKYDGQGLPAMTSNWKTIVRPLSIDGLDFIDAPSLVVPSKPTSSASTTEVPPTPIQYRLNTIQHLKNIISGFSETPSPTLIGYFQCCAENPDGNIKLRLNEMRDRYVNGHLASHSSSSSSSQNGIPLQRFSLITRLYFKSLQTLLTQEEERLSRTDFSALLHIDTFHRSLVTCCSLVVNHTYDEQTSASETLEYLLDVFSIEAYHMCKVVECFIKAEPELSKASIHHLKLCENHILESLAWKPASPLFDVLSSASQNYSPSSGSQSTPTDLHSYNVGAAQFLTPTRRRVQDRPLIENGQLPRSRSLAVFLNKVCRLAYHRLQLLCTALNIPRDVVSKIWTCLEYCIKYRCDLIKGRHIDQIMMCCLYAISRVVNKEVKFKTVVGAYESLPHQPASSVYKRVPMKDPTVTDSIIAFYNQLYMQTMKSYLLQFSPDRKPPPLSPAPRVGHSPLKSPKKLGQQIFLSPMKAEDAVRLSMTPRSNKLYCFGGLETSRQLQSINDSIKQARTPPSATKRLLFQDSKAIVQSSKSDDLVKPVPSSGKKIKFDS